jgi:hypothetical protein
MHSCKGYVPNIRWIAMYLLTAPFAATKFQDAVAAHPELLLNKIYISVVKNKQGSLLACADVIRRAIDQLIVLYTIYASSYDDLPADWHSLLAMRIAVSRKLSIDEVRLWQTVQVHSVAASRGEAPMPYFNPGNRQRAF